MKISKLSVAAMCQQVSKLFKKKYKRSLFISVSHPFFIFFLFLAKPQKRNEYSVNDVKRHWNWIISIKRLNCHRSFERPFLHSIVLPRIKTRNKLWKDKTIIKTAVKSSKVMDCKHWLLHQFRKAQQMKIKDSKDTLKMFLEKKGEGGTNTLCRS